MAVRKDGVNKPTLALGIEFDGVIFWMDIWIDLSGSASWGAGDLFFGNIDRDAGTMQGIVIDPASAISTFTGSQP